MNKSATFEAVRTAMETLEKDLIFPSLDAIQKLIGGNKGTIGTERENVWKWRREQAESAQPDAGAQQDNDALAQGVNRIVNPIAEKIADIAPAVAEQMKRAIDAERATNQHTIEALVSDHKHAMDRQMNMNDLQAKAAAENAAALVTCEADNDALKERITSQDAEINQLRAENEKMRTENSSLSSEKYTAIDRSVELSNRLGETQAELVSMQDRLHQGDRELIECRLKLEQTTLAFQVSQNESKKVSKQCAELQSQYAEMQGKLEELHNRYAGVEDYANGVLDTNKRFQAATTKRLDAILEHFGAIVSEKMGR